MGDEQSYTSLRGRAYLDCDALLGDWHVLSAVVTLTSGDTATAFGGMNITADTTLSTFPASYLPDGSIIIDTVPFVVSLTEADTLIMRGKDIEIKISRSPLAALKVPLGGFRGLPSLFSLR